MKRCAAEHVRDGCFPPHLSEGANERLAARNGAPGEEGSDCSIERLDDSWYEDLLIVDRAGTEIALFVDDLRWLITTGGPAALAALDAQPKTAVQTNRRCPNG